MNTFKKATKRITAVAGAAALVSSAVFGASLANYPTNFVKKGKFDGQVVIGADGDSAAATSIIGDLKTEFSGDSAKVKLTAKKTSSGNKGDVVSALDDKSTWNYNAKVEKLVETLDEDSTKLLEDGDFDGETYSQTLEMGKTDISFSHKLFDDVDGEKEVKTGVFVKDGAVYANYTLNIEDKLSSKLGDYKGETLEIMGNEFTVISADENKLTLVGGSNKVSLGEGEASTVTVDGVSYEVEVQSVSESSSKSKVLVSINGESKSVDSDEVEEIAGVSIGITEVVESNRDSVKGYATLVIGGQKLEFEGSSLKINDEKFSDLDQYDDYDVETKLTGFTSDSSSAKLEIIYKVDENVLLEEGDVLIDPLFDSFTLSFDGINDVEYSDFKITTTNDGVDFSGKLYDGEDLVDDFKLTTDDKKVANLFLGSNTERIYFKGSLFNGSQPKELDGDGDIKGVTHINKSDKIEKVSLNLEMSGSNIKGLKFFDIEGSDKEDMKIYELTNVDFDKDTHSKTELSFEELIGKKDFADVKTDKVESDLDLDKSVIGEDDSAEGKYAMTFDLSKLSKPELYLENELLMNFTDVEAVGFDKDTTTSVLAFSYSDDAEADDSSVYGSGADFKVLFQRADDEDDAIKVELDDAKKGLFEKFSEIKKGSDYEIAVDKYGTKILIDAEDKDEMTISVPSEEVFAKVSFNFGDAGSEVKTLTVDADDKEAKVKELEEAGYTVTAEDMPAGEAVEFDIAAPVMAEEVSGADDMIVVGGPAVNAVARQLLGIEEYSVDKAGVAVGEAVIKFFDKENSVLVYGFDAAATQAAANKLNAGGLTGEEVNVQ